MKRDLEKLFNSDNTGDDKDKDKDKDKGGSLPITTGGTTPPRDESIINP